MKNTSPNYAQSYVALAHALGSSRQRICYHARQPNAPRPAADGRHDIQAWREYFKRLGLPVGLPLAPNLLRSIHVDTVHDLIRGICEALPDLCADLTAAHKLSRAASDKLALDLWFYMASLAEVYLEADHFSKTNVSNGGGSLDELWQIFCPSRVEPAEAQEFIPPPAIEKIIAALLPKQKSK